MSKARILGSSAKILVKHPVTQFDIKIGEIDKFTATSETNITKSRPIGKSMPRPNMIYGGWSLRFEGGKVDWELALQIHSQDLTMRLLGYHPTFNIIQQIKYYDGTVEEYTFPNTIIYGYEITMDGSNEFIGESFEGYSHQRDKGIFDIATIVTTVSALAGEIIASAAQEALDEILNEMANGLGL